MPIYIGDYLADTADLTTEEHGAYLLILMAMWRSREALPLHRLRPIAKVAATRWADIWGVISRFFDVDGDGLVTQRRLQRELELALEKKRRASDRGQKGGLARAQAQADSKLARAQAQADSKLDPGSACAEEDCKPLRMKVKVTVTDPIRANLPIGLSSDPSRQTPQDLPRTRSPGVWSLWDWRRKYGDAWCAKYGGTAIGGDGDADVKLGDLLASLPDADLLAAQARAPEMFREFLAEGGEPAKARHRWSWFVGRFEALRVPLDHAAARKDPKTARSIEALGRFVERGEAAE
jgi:uncharacterized protein YdaU (DUF1376 family)